MLPLHVASLLAILLGHGTLLHADTDTGLLAYFSFNNNTNDVSGNGHHAQIYDNSGNVTLTTDRFGNANSAYSFGASANGVDPVIWGTGMDLAGKSLTISFWIKGMFSQALDDYGGVGVGTIIPGTPNPGGTAGKHLHIYSNSERTLFSFFYDDISVAQTIPADQWAQLSFVYDNDTMARNIYLNGNVVASQVAAFGFSGNDVFTMNGRNGVSMDDVRFYERALSADDISQLHAIESVPETGTSASLILIGLGMIAVQQRRLGPSQGVRF